MDALVSTWSGNVESLPENYIFPAESRPGSQVNVPFSDTIPVINLKRSYSPDDRKVLIQEILEAGREFGFFRVVDHGVSEELMKDTLSVFNEVFTMPAEDKASLCSDKPMDYNSCNLYSSSGNYATEKHHLWRDTLRHPCHPLEEFMPRWPEKPSRYRDIVGEYTTEARKLGLRILELVSEGLGLEPGYFSGDLSSSVLISVNHYPPCPDPSLTLGINKHCDPDLITILLQDDVYGLQFLKDGEWFGVRPQPTAFLVNIGYQLQIASNGKVKSSPHRVVTNSSVPRTTCALFINPSGDTVVEPAKALISDDNPPLYGSFQFKDFLAQYAACSADEELTLAPFKFRS